MAYEFPDGVFRAYRYEFHERGRWRYDYFHGYSLDECDGKAVEFLTKRNRGAVAIVIRCPSTVIWELVDFPKERAAKPAAAREATK